MHELSIAAGIMESLTEFAETYPSRKILGVRLAVGELTCVESDQLSFCYSSLIPETAFEQSTLEIERTEAEVFCRYCSYQGRPKYWDDALSDTLVATLQCPTCGKAVEAVRGHECTIKTIRYVE
jgi:hydrogenase nickel incorporation protein HypA/HybF